MAFQRLPAIVPVLWLIGLAYFKESDVASVSAIGFEGGEEARSHAPTNLGLRLMYRIDHRNVGKVELA